MVRLTDRPDMTLDVYRGRKTTMQQMLTGKAVMRQMPERLLFTYAISSIII